MANAMTDSIDCRVFPWGCISGFLKRIVLDAAPRHEFTNFIPAAIGVMKKKAKKIANNNNNDSIPNYNKSDLQSPLIMRSITTVEEERNV